MERSDAERIIHIVTSFLLTFAAALFVFGYNGIKYFNHVCCRDIARPTILRWMGLAAPWMLLLPFCLLAVGLIWKDKPLVPMVIRSFALVFSLSWVLLCIYLGLLHS